MPRTTFFCQLSSMPVAAMGPLAVLLAVCSLVTVANGKSFAATNFGQGSNRYEGFVRADPSYHLLHNARDPSIESITQSGDEQRADSVHDNKGSVRKAEEKKFRKPLQGREFQKSVYSVIERLGSDKEQFQKMIMILRNQIRKSGRKTSDSTELIEGIVGRCSARPDRWCRDVASVLVDMVHDDETGGIRLNPASHHRGKRNALETRGHSDVDRFINLHDRFLRDDFSQMTPAEWDAHQKISQDQQSITQYVFKELQNLLYKSRYELQNKSKEVQIFKPLQKTTPVLKPVIFADITEESPHLQEDEYFPSNSFTDNLPSVSFDSGTFSTTVAYNESIAYEQEKKEQFEKNIFIPKPVMIANTTKETNDRQENEYFPSNLYTDNRQPESFNTGYTSSHKVAFDESIAAEQDRDREDFEDVSDLLDENTKFSDELLSTTNESPSADTSITFVKNSIFDGGLFFNDWAASNMSPTQESPTPRTTPSEKVPIETGSTPTQVGATFPSPRTPTQKILNETSSTYNYPNQTTPSEIPSSTLSRRTVRLPASTNHDYEHVSRTSPTFARTTLSPSSMTIRSTPRDVLFRTIVPFTPVPPAQYVDNSEALIHEYHDYVVDYESHIINPSDPNAVLSDPNAVLSDPNAVLESLLSQQQSKDMSLNSEYYEYYDEGSNPRTVDPNEFGVSHQPMPVSDSLDSTNSEYDDSNYPLYEYFIISEYPEGVSVSNANDENSLISAPDTIYHQADSGDESIHRTVDPLHHLLESVTKTSTAPLNPTSVKNTIKYEIFQNENVHGNAQQIPQYISSTKFTSSRNTATPPTISPTHMPRKPLVEHSFTIPAPIQNPTIYQTTPRLVTNIPINDQNQKVPIFHYEYSDPLFNKEFLLQKEVPVKSTPLYVTTQKVTESPVDNHLFSSYNTLFQQLTTNPVVVRTTETPESSNTAELLLTLQKNLETLSKLQQSQQKAKETTNRLSAIVAPFNIDHYPYNVPELSSTSQNSEVLSDNEEMKKSSLEETRDKPPPRPSLLEVLRASMKEDAEILKHQANILKTVTEDNTSASPKPKVPSVSSLFFSIPSTPSNDFVKFQQLDPVTIVTTDKPVMNNFVRNASETPTEVSSTIEPTTAAVVSVVSANSESPFVNSRKTTTAVPAKDENFVFGIPLSIIESEFRLTSAEKEKYVSGQNLENPNTPSGIEKHVTVINKTVEDSTEPVKPEEIKVKAGANQEENRQSSVPEGGILASFLESERRTVSSEEEINVLDIETHRIRDEINNKMHKQSLNKLSPTTIHHELGVVPKSQIQHELGVVPKSQIGFFPQLMATLFAPFRTTTEASRKSTVSMKGTTLSNFHFTSRAYTQSDVSSTHQALFNPSTELTQEKNSKPDEYLLNGHSEQGPFGKNDGETTENTYITETIHSVGTNAYDPTIPMEVKESSLSTSNSTSIENHDQSSPEEVGLPMTTSDFMVPLTGDYPWLYEDLASIDGDSTLPQQMATEFSNQPSHSFESTTQELTSPIQTDPITWSDEKQVSLNLDRETTPTLEDLDEGFPYTFAPTFPSLIVTDTVPITDNVGASATEPSVQYGQGYEMGGYSINKFDSTVSYDQRTDELSETDEQTAMLSQKTTPEQTSNTLDDYLTATESGKSTEMYESGVTLQQLLHTAKTLMASSTVPSHQSDTESDTESPADMSTEQPQLETALTALFLTNSIEEDYVYVTTAAPTFMRVTYSNDENTDLPIDFSGDTSMTDDFASSTSSSDITEIDQVVSSSSPDTRTTSHVTATTDSTSDLSSSTFSDYSTTFDLISTTPTPKGSPMSSSITIPISLTIKSVTSRTTNLAPTKPGIGTTSRPAASLLPQLNSLGSHFVNASSSETRPPSILGSLNVLRRSSNNGFAHTAETLALSRSLCSAASNKDMPRTPSMRYILQKCAMLKLSGLL